MKLVNVEGLDYMVYNDQTIKGVTKALTEYNNLKKIHGQAIIHMTGDDEFLVFGFKMVTPIFLDKPNDFGFFAKMANAIRSFIKV